MTPDFTEVCGRPAIFGYQNQESMSPLPAFRTDMRIMGGNACWLDPRMNGNCTYATDGGTSADPVICTMTATG
ncbi:hypothetical protein HNR06_004551 [Nocardiopsis arvandica]|uniref:Uncharacterized protein n=1 Tax=Nocardiopsis sinuspersici TaxID=501010 RepID=A0A7Z0BMW1_9ACTN|nr:hypothetical protein [Nocardiopsis sinuspersici]